MTDADTFSVLRPLSALNDDSGGPSKLGVPVGIRVKMTSTRRQGPKLQGSGLKSLDYGTKTGFDFLLLFC